VAPTADGTCAYCQRSLADPTTWVLTRVSDAPAVQPPAYPLEIAVGPASRAARTVVVIILVAVLLVIMGSVVAGVLVASRATKQVTQSLTPPSISLPEGVTLPPGVTLPRTRPTAPTSTGFVTPVANPRVRAPVNDVAAAAAAVQAKVGRPLMAKSIHLYPDGRIIFEIQAADDPKGVDQWTWKGGAASGPEQGLIGADPKDFYPVAGLDLSNLARLCDAALGATGIPDGVIDSPYLLKISRGLTWYIPVQSQSRSSNHKTYWAAPDGSKPQVF